MAVYPQTHHHLRKRKTTLWSPARFPHSLVLGIPDPSGGASYQKLQPLSLRRGVARGNEPGPNSECFWEEVGLLDRPADSLARQRERRRDVARGPTRHRGKREREKEREGEKRNEGRMAASAEEEYVKTSTGDFVFKKAHVHGSQNLYLKGKVCLPTS